MACRSGEDDFGELERNRTEQDRTMESRMDMRDVCAGRGYEKHDTIAELHSSTIITLYNRNPGWKAWRFL